MVKVKVRRPPKKRDPKRGASLERAKWRFIEFLQVHGSVRYACRCARVSRDAIYNQRNVDPAFAKAWVDALDDAADNLEESLYERATTHDTVAAIFLLKGMRPEKYRERQHVTTVEEKSIDEAIEAEFRVIREEGIEVTEPSHQLPMEGSANGNGRTKEENSNGNGL